MIATRPSPALLVKLRESTVALLMAQRSGEDETLDAMIVRLTRAGLPDLPRAAVAPPTSAAPESAARARQRRRTGKYELALLGEVLGAETLAELFGALIDTLADLDAETVEKLASMRSRKRAYVAREKSAIHPGRPDLPIRKTDSGWWISANIGKEDLRRALRATCLANGLIYACDITLIES